MFMRDENFFRIDRLVFGKCFFDLIDAFFLLIAEKWRCQVYGTRTPVAVVQFDQEKEVNLMIAQALTAYFDVSKDGLEQLATYDFDKMIPKFTRRPVI